MKFLAEKYPQKRLRWILGGDHIAKLHGWKDIDAIAELADFICARRDGFRRRHIETSALPAFRIFCLRPSAPQFHRNQGAARRGEKNLKMLDPDVESYISKQII